MAANEEKKRTRSPAYPAIGLEEAIQKAKELWDEEGRDPFTPEAAASHWSYKATSSAVSQIVSALKQFGLLTEEAGSNGTRRIKLSDMALDILLHDENSVQRRDAIKLAALGPKIHWEIWEKYKRELPSDVSLRVYLLRERDVPFNKDQVDKFISQLRGTIEFAKLGPHDKMPDEDGAIDDSKKKDGGTAESEEQRRHQWRRPMQIEQGFQQATFPLSGGDALVQWPENLSADEFADFQDWLGLIIRKVKRSMSGKHAELAKKPEADDEPEDS